MKRYPQGTPGNRAEIEHIDNNEHNKSLKNICMCCGSCNRRKSDYALKNWLKSPYCVANKINSKTVAPIVKSFIKAHPNK